MKSGLAAPGEAALGVEKGTLAHPNSARIC
jgi:hypothetical protein